MLDSPPFVPGRWLQAVIYTGVAISAFLVNGLLVAYVWAYGVNLATFDRAVLGEDNFHIEPMPTTYKWLLGAVLAANVGVLLYLLVRRQYLYTVSLIVGAVVPMGYLISILFTA